MNWKIKGETSNIGDSVLAQVANIQFLPYWLQPLPACAHMARAHTHTHAHAIKQRTDAGTETRGRVAGLSGLGFSADSITSLLIQMNPFSVSPQNPMGSHRSLPQAGGTDVMAKEAKVSSSFRDCCLDRSVHSLVRHVCSQVPPTPPESEFLLVRLQEALF